MDDGFIEWLNALDSGRLPLWSEWKYLEEKMPSSGLDDGRPIFGKVVTSETNGITVMITNFIRLWTEILRPNEFMERVKKLNPNLEADVGTMLNEISAVVSGHRQFRSVLVVCGTDDQSLRIAFKANFEGMPLQWECTLERMDAEGFYTYVVTPLMAAVSQYNRRESDLIGVIMKKDQELEQSRLTSHSRDQKGIENFQPRTWSSNDLRSQVMLRQKVQEYKELYAYFFTSSFCGSPSRISCDACRIASGKRESQEFTSTQQTVKPVTLSRAIVSNDVFSAVCLSDLYLRDCMDAHGDHCNRDTQHNPDTVDRVDSESSNSRLPEGATVMDREPPPAPSTNQKRKKLRL